MQINQQAPEFGLPDLEGRIHRLRDYHGRIAIVNFWSCECPHAERTDALLVAMCEKWGDKLALLSIASNVSESEEAVAATARARKLPVVLLDRQHRVADLYEALATPQIFLVDRGGILRYTGAVDDARFGRKTPTRHYLAEAVAAVMVDQAPSLNETPAYGCAIIREAVE